MKKSLFIISAAVTVFAVALTACGKTDSNIIKDSSGNTHVVVTDKEGNSPQDSFGNLYEEVTDSDGNKVTQVINFPVVSTNKSGKIMENSCVKIEVPKNWKASDDSNVFRLRHGGECVAMNIDQCEIDVDVVSNLTQQETYDKNKKSVEALKRSYSDVDDIKEFDTKINGKDAKALSYRIKSENTTVYYYCVSNGYPNVEITVAVYDKCYADSKSVVEMLESCMTFKTLSPATTTTTTTTTTVDE